MSNFRDYMKKNHHWIWENIMGGQKADDYTAKNMELYDSFTGAIENSKNAIKETFDIVSWFKNNWQIAIVGFVALLVLLRD